MAVASAMGDAMFYPEVALGHALLATRPDVLIAALDAVATALRYRKAA